MAKPTRKNAAPENTKKKGRQAEDEDEEEEETTDDEENEGSDEEEEEEEEEEDEDEGDLDDEDEEDDDDSDSSDDEDGSALSFDPDDQEEGGGLWAGRGKIIKASCLMWDYNGKSAVKSPALHMTIKPHGEGDPIEQYWSAGDRKRIVATKDGSTFTNRPGVNQTGFNKQTNAGELFRSLKEVGFPIAKLGGDFRKMVGVDAEFVRKAQPKREGLEGQKANATTLVISKVYSTPFDKKSKKAVADDEDEEEVTTTKTSKDKTAKPKKASGLTPAQKIDTEAEEAILAVVKENGDKLLFSRLSKALYGMTSVKKSPNRDEILERAADADWMGEDSRPFDFDGKVIKPAYKRSK